MVGVPMPDASMEKTLADASSLGSSTSVPDPLPIDAPALARSPFIAASLSVLWPGLGQLYTGRRKLAALFAIPVFILLLVVLYQLRQGPIVFLARFASPTFSGTAAVLAVALGVWQLASIGNAFVAGGGGTHPAQKVFVIVLGVAVFVAYGGAGFLLATASSAESRAFNPISSLVDLTTPSPDAAGTLSGGDGTTSPSGTPSINHRVTILFNGVDSAPGRGETLYDSILVVSFDPGSNSIEMVSVPRDTASFPVYFGKHPAVPVTLRINAVPEYVSHGWLRSPDSPYQTLVREVGYLVGIPIDYYAVMDLGGFVKMIDDVGGIDIDNPSPINDPVYATPQGVITGYSLSAGRHHLNGEGALAYVRSRHGADNSDWARDARQQQVLVALLHKMAQPSELLAMPGLLSTLGSSVTTNFPSDEVADYVAIGQDVPASNIHQVVLGPPYTILDVNRVNTAATTCLDNARVAKLSRQLFGADSLWYGKPDPANTCP